MIRMAIVGIIGENATRLTTETRRARSQLADGLAGCTKGDEAVKTKATISHDRAMVRELRRSRKFAVEYLRAALADSDEPQVLLIALRHIAEARGGVAKVAKAAGIQRESLHRALSTNGNPRLSTLAAVTKAVGMRLTVEAA
ncbi:MAG: addiction module antidote protein [Tepidisphaeraceae bacterium]